jgi:hypothetical protein
MTSTDHGRQADFFEALPSPFPTSITEEAEQRTAHGRLTFVLDHLELLPDERSEHARDPMYRSSDGRLWETHDSRMSPVRAWSPNDAIPDWSPHAYAIEPRTVDAPLPGMSKYVQLSLWEVDPDLYAAAVEQRRKQDAEVVALQEAKRQQERAALEAAPKRVMTASMRPMLYVLDVLDVLDVNAGTLTLIDGRIITRLPNVRQPELRTDIDALRPLLIASECGTRDIACDIEHCAQTAQHVGIGGCFLCIEHASP